MAVDEFQVMDVIKAVVVIYQDGSIRLIEDNYRINQLGNLVGLLSKEEEAELDKLLNEEEYCNDVFDNLFARTLDKENQITDNNN